MRATLGSVLIAWAGLQAQAAPLDDLLATERDFAQRAAESGLAVALREHLAGDAFVLRPDAVPAREWLDSHMQPDDRVRWTPLRHEWSCTGDLALGAGPWIDATAPGALAGGGWLLLVWQRPSGDELWRLVLEQTLDAPQGAAEAAATTSATPRPTAGESVDCGSAEVGALERAENELNAGLARRGYRAALLRAGGTDLRLLREGAAPQVATALAVPERERIRLMATARGLLTMPGADLAISHGEFSAQPARRSKRKHPGTVITERTAYLRVWRHDGRNWRVVLDALSTTPDASGSTQ